MPKPDFIAPGFVARRAEIVEDDEKTKFAGTDLSGYYCIVNAKTGAVVGIAKSIDQAKHLAGKRDTQFGACVHKIVPPTKPAPAG
jgi:hypothetical protein